MMSHAEADPEQLGGRQLDPVRRIVADAPHYIVAREDEGRRGASVVSPIANLLDEPGDSVRVANGSRLEPLDARNMCGIRIHVRAGVEVPFIVGRNRVIVRSIARAGERLCADFSESARVIRAPTDGLSFACRC